MDKWIKENKITLFTIIVFIIASGLVYFNLNMDHDIENSAITNNLDLQIKCATQAKTFFDYFITDPESKETSELSNHYNTKLNICFALIKQYKQTGTGISVSNGTQKDLYDAVEKKVYGSYAWMSESPKKYWDVSPLWCDTYINGNTNNHKVCESEEEYDAFTSIYMNN